MSEEKEDIVLTSSPDEEVVDYLAAQKWSEEEAMQARREINAKIAEKPWNELQVIQPNEEELLESNNATISTSPQETGKVEVKAVKDSNDFDWISEQYMIEISKGTAPSTAFKLLKIPDIPAIRRQLMLVLIKNLAGTYTFSPEVTRAAVDSVSMKFFMEAAVKGDSENALKWASQIKKDERLGYSKSQKAILIPIGDAQKFLEADVVDVEFIDKE